MESANPKQPTVRLLWLRKITSGLLMLVGAVLMIRGIGHSLEHHLGLGPLIQTAVVGGLVFALGLARWRYWRNREE